MHERKKKKKKKETNCNRITLGLVSLILSHVGVEEALQDALQVVSAYHHLNTLDAFSIRLRNLCRAGKFKEAANILEFGTESGEIPHVKQQDALDKMEINNSNITEEIEPLQSNEVISIGLDTFNYLIQSMNHAKIIAEDAHGNEDVAKSRYASASFGAAEIMRCIQRLEENDSKNNSTHNRLSSSKWINSTSSNNWVDLKQLTSKANSIRDLYIEYEIMVEWDDYDNDMMKQKLFSSFVINIFKSKSSVAVNM